MQRLYWWAVPTLRYIKGFGDPKMLIAVPLDLRVCRGRWERWSRRQRNYEAGLGYDLLLRVSTVVG